MTNEYDRIVEEIAKKSGWPMPEYTGDPKPKKRRHRAKRPKSIREIAAPYKLPRHLYS